MVSPLPYRSPFGSFLMEFKSFYEVADAETRRGDIPAFYSFQLHCLHQADCLAFCTLCCVILNLMMFPDVFLCEPRPETGVVRAPTSSLN